MGTKREFVDDDELVDFMYIDISRSAESWKECERRLGKRRRLVLVDEDEDEGEDDGVLSEDSKRRIQELIDRSYYFDRLPEDIVLSVVDKLGWKDAAKTALLSWRFRHLSKSSILHRKSMDFEQSSGAPCLEFVEFVNHFLHIHEGSKVDSLRIAFDAVYPTEARDDDVDMDAKFKDGFKKWLTFARAKSVRSLDIDLCVSKLDKSPLFCPQFPMFDGWDKLISLSLKMVRVGDADLEHGLKSCLVNLESLFIQCSNCLERVVVASPKLKRLEMRRCLKIRSISIDVAPNLECFTYEGHPAHVVIINLKQVPNLSLVSLGGGALSQNSMAELAKVQKLDKLELLGYSHYALSVFTPQFAMFEAWDRLTTLSMKSVKVGDADIRHLMNMESLSIHDAPDLKFVLVRSSKLKRLEIRCCSDIRSIDIDSAPNLECLCYQGPGTLLGQSAVRVKDAPKLSRVFMGKKYCGKLRLVWISNL